MSKPSGKRGVAKAAVSAKTATPATDEASTAERSTPGTSKSASGDIDLKDDGSNNGDKKDTAKPGSTDETATAKPQSAGASVRDAAQKLLGLTMRQEWTPVEQVIKTLEKAVASSNDDMNLSPLAGVLDPVS